MYYALLFFASVCYPFHTQYRLADVISSRGRRNIDILAGNQIDETFFVRRCSCMRHG